MLRLRLSSVNKKGNASGTCTTAAGSSRTSALERPSDPADAGIPSPRRREHAVPSPWAGGGAKAPPKQPLPQLLCDGLVREPLAQPNRHFRIHHPGEADQRRPVRLHTLTPDASPPNVPGANGTQARPRGSGPTFGRARRCSRTRAFSGSKVLARANGGREKVGSRHTRRRSSSCATSRRKSACAGASGRASTIGSVLSMLVIAAVGDADGKRRDDPSAMVWASDCGCTTPRRTQS